MSDRPIPATNEIGAYFHCRKCLDEIKDGTAARAAGHPVSPQMYRQLDIGYTTLGFQVWCTRHDINVMHVDFEGQQHPANLGVAEKLDG